MFSNVVAMGTHDGGHRVAKRVFHNFGQYQGCQRHWKKDEENKTFEVVIRQNLVLNCILLEQGARRIRKRLNTRYGASGYVRPQK